VANDVATVDSQRERELSAREKQRLALLMPLMPADERGALTGFYSVSRGIGITIGPVLAGGLISLTAGGVFEATQGFQAVWAVPCLATLASLPLLGKLECAADDRKELREQ
jgi:MFS family permease